MSQLLHPAAAEADAASHGASVSDDAARTATITACTAPLTDASGLPIEQSECYCTTSTCGAGICSTPALPCTRPRRACLPPTSTSRACGGPRPRDPNPAGASTSRTRATRSSRRGSPTTRRQGMVAVGDATSTGAEHLLGTLYAHAGARVQRRAVQPVARDAHDGRHGHVHVHRRRQRHVQLHGQRREPDQGDHARGVRRAAHLHVRAHPPTRVGVNYQDLWWTRLPDPSRAGASTSRTQGDIDLRDVVHVRPIGVRRCGCR